MYAQSAEDSVAFGWAFACYTFITADCPSVAMKRGNDGIDGIVCARFSWRRKYTRRTPF
jgi:hypothetical protein